MVVVRVMLGLGLSLTLLMTMIIWHYRHIITHYKYVHNALQMHAFSKMLPNLLMVVKAAHAWTSCSPEQIEKNKQTSYRLSERTLRSSVKLFWWNWWKRTNLTHGSLPSASPCSVFSLLMTHQPLTGLAWILHRALLFLFFASLVFGFLMNKHFSLYLLICAGSKV